MICLGIWALGLLIYTIFVRVSVPVLAGEVTYEKRFGNACRRTRPKARERHREGVRVP